MATSQDSTDSRLTELEVEFRSMGKQINEIASDMKKVLEMTQQITLLNERQVNHRNDIDRAFTEIRQCRQYLETDIAAVEADGKANKALTQSVKTETESWINKGKGAWAVASVLWVLIYGIFGYLLNDLYKDFKLMRQEVTMTSYQVKSHLDHAKPEVYLEKRKPTLIE